jgi:hypothetical protein
MGVKNIAWIAAAGVVVYVLMRSRDNGYWTIPGSQQDKMLQEQDMAFQVFQQLTAGGQKTWV